MKIKTLPMKIQAISGGRFRSSRGVVSNHPGVSFSIIPGARFQSPRGGACNHPGGRLQSSRMECDEWMTCGEWMTCDERMT